MAFKLLLFLFFLSPLTCFSLSQQINRNPTSTLQANLRTDPGAFVLINPEQVHRLETTIRRFLSKAAAPIKRQIVLRSNSSNETALQSTIREICESIRQKAMEFAKDLGLVDTVKKFEHSLTDMPLSEDWYTELMLQNAYMIRDLGNVINEISSAIDQYFGEGNSTAEMSEQLTRQRNSFKFLGVVHDAAGFSQMLTQCLLELVNAKVYKSAFSLNRSISDLTKYPPEQFVKILETRVKNISNESVRKNRAWRKPWHIFLCFSLMNNKEINYDDCSRELQHLEICIKSMQNQSTNETQSVDVKSWTKAIRRLSDCQIHTDKNGEAEVSCKSVRRVPNNIKQKMKYIFERILDKRINRASPFHRVANDLGDTLSKNAWGLRFVDELCHYVSIFEEGKMKLRRFTMLKEKDKKAMARHNEISNALKVYKRGALLRTFGSIKKMHSSATEFEKFLIQGVKITLNEAWQSHVQILSSMMSWMTKLLELYSGESDGEDHVEEQSSPQNDVVEDEDMNSQSLEEFKAAVRSKSNVMKDVDNSMNDLIESMNRLSKYRRSNEKSTLTCIANNILLVTILMETIGFVSSLYCFGRNERDEQSLNLDDEWERTRRSLSPFEEKRIVDLISSEYFLLEVQENSTITF